MKNKGVSKLEDEQKVVAEIDSYDENISKAERRARAIKKVKELKGFYIHLTIYLTINTVLLMIKIVGNSYYGEGFMGPLWHFSTFGSWLFWGIGLGFHASKVFGFFPFFRTEWERRQIQKYIEQEKKEAEKFR
ncbi:2TM domain-containing protein [Maribacter algicola]|uniref:2TM domain-containing protein n=1 Tax=Meishania litoralis TaxID=3434685 RepID=A0ACC7LKP1_9FLAO